MNLDQAAPNATLEFEGKSSRLLLSMYAISQIKRVTGKNLLQGEMNLSDPEHITSLVWGGLLDSIPELDGEVVQGKPDENAQNGLKRVGRWFTLDKLNLVSSCLEIAFEQAGISSKGSPVEKKD